MTGAAWVLIVGFGVMGAYGLLNLVTPRTTIRWQNRATARHHNDPVGAWFQRLFGQRDPAADGSRDPMVRRRVRYTGLTQITVAAVVIGLVISFSSH